MGTRLPLGPSDPDGKRFKGAAGSRHFQQA
jgi:hypothetical protein